MTQTAHPSDAVPATVLPESLGLRVAEIAALISLSGGVQAEATAMTVGLDRELAEPDCIAAGVSSLVARGLAGADGEGGLNLGGAVAVMAHALGSATRWIQIDLEAPAATDTVFSIEGSDHAILAQRLASSWFLRACQPGLTGAHAEFALVKAHLDARPQARASLLNHSDPGHRLLVRREGGAYAVGLLSAGAERAEEEGPLGEAAVVERIERFRQA